MDDQSYKLYCLAKADTYLTVLHNLPKLQHPTTFSWPDGSMGQLNCFTIDWTAAMLLPKGSRSGITTKTTQWASVNPHELQFNFDMGKFNGGARQRVIAYRAAFAGADGFGNPDMTVSHLCHWNRCLNPLHHVLESLEDNKGRNGCAGGTNCFHQERCIRPGPYYKGLSTVRCPNQAVVTMFNL